jgi:putative SOS response-associated peptidase YedK
MHKPVPDPATKLPVANQDKRSVVPIERAGVDRWLHGSPAEATELLRLAPLDIFAAVPIEWR